MKVIARSDFLRLASGSLLLSMLTACAGSGGSTVTAACDHACLKGHIDGYVAAMRARDPARLPLDVDARFTVDEEQGLALLRLGFMRGMPANTPSGW